jgi:hypothetical protein
MSNFTQLNLQGNSNSKPTPKPTPGTGNPLPSNTTKKTTKQHGKAKVAAIVGSFMAATLIVTFTLGTNACSKSKPAVAANTTAAVQPAPAPVMPTTPYPTETPKPAKKSPRQHKLATFKSPEFGLSFRYPKHYDMKEGEQTDATQTNLASSTMNFVQAGGQTLTTVELPQKLYPGTDFNSAFFTVSVNPRLTADDCGQFAFPEVSGLDDGSAAPAKVNIAGTEYNEMNDLVSDGSQQANARYYHLYQNNVCYEFALGLQTASDEDTTKVVKPVNRDKVFDKLQWMLSTVKIKPVVTTPTPAVSASAPSSTPETTNQ